ncbi:MAG: tyrosine-type recombinase/integrase, partial [Phycisphaerae bacterium]
MSEYYRRADGTATSQVTNITCAMNLVIELYGDLRADDFGPRKLKVVRDAMVAADWCTTTVQQRVGMIRRVWRWLASEELVPADVWHGLRALPPLQAGRGEARATPPVAPVPEADIEAVVRRVPDVIAAMIKLQYYTGARPGEVCAMRAADLETGGAVWVYTPQTHKQTHLGRTRRILLGPKAQDIVRPYLAGRRTTAYLFSPLEAKRQRLEKCRTHRAGGHGTVAKGRLQDRYTTRAYGQYIKHVCLRHGIQPWSPNRLRHNAATRLRKEFGLDVAQAVLGHTKADVTQVYAEVDLRKAASAMAKIG